MLPPVAASPMERLTAAPLLRPGFAIRERLDRRVDASPVLAIVAPAGWGKTQLMVHLFHRALRRGEAAAWVSLPRRTSGALLSQLREAAFPEAAGPADLDDLLRRLIKRPTALFVDDATAEHGLLWAVSAALPEGSRLILAAREGPPSVANRIDVTEMAFSDTEARALLRTTIPAATGEQIGAIAATCDGWPLAFNLAEAAFNGMAPEHHSLGHLANDLADLAESLLAPALDTEQRAMLAELSAADEIEHGLASVITGSGDIAALLAASEESALARRDDPVGPLRFARYAQPLLTRWRNALPVERLHAIHHSAAAWFDARGRPLDVIRHAIAGGDGSQATHLLRQNLLYMVATGDFDRANNWVEVLPGAEIKADETLRFSVALAHVAAGEPHRAQPYLGEDRRPQHLLLRTLVANFADDPDTGARLMDEISDAGRLPEPLRPIHTNLSRWIDYSLGDFRTTDAITADQSAEQAHLPYAYGNWFALFRRATRRLALGHAWQAVDLLELPLADAERQLGRESFPATLLSVALAAALLQVGRQDSAAAVLADRAATRRNQLTVDPLALSMAIQARLAQTADDPSASGDVIDRFRRIAMERGLPRLQAQCVGEQMRLLGVRGEPAVLERSMTVLLGIADDALPFAINGPWIRLPALMGAVHAARGLGLRGRALALLADAEPIAAALGQAMDSAEIALLRVAMTPGDPPVAAPPIDGDDLEALAARLGVPLPPTWNGVPRAGRGMGDEPITVVPRVLPSTAVTSRERSVLRELGRAQSNKSIARALGLGQETVKWHVANLLGKLGARDRRELAQKAVELGLLGADPSPTPRPGEVRPAPTSL